MSGCIVIVGIPFDLSVTLLEFISGLYDESSSILATGLYMLLEFGCFATIVVPLGGTILTYAVAYIPARAFLIAESCIQLARLPPGAYVTPDWSKYYPHIS